MMAKATTTTAAALLLCGVAVASAGRTLQDTSSPAAETMPGGGRDQNGCIPSAGYVWCAAKGECVRPWETPCAESKCPGASNGQGLAGGWSEAEADNSSVDAAVAFVLQSLNVPEATSYTVKVACTQVVAGTNIYFVVELSSGTEIEAKVYQPLTPSNEPFEIQEINYPAASKGGNAEVESKCPGASNGQGLAGGWSEVATDNANVDAAVAFVLQTLNVPDATDYTVEVACTQVVAGTNIFFVVKLPNGMDVEAKVYQPLPPNNMAFEIQELHYVPS